MADEIIPRYSDDPEDNLISYVLQTIIWQMHANIKSGTVELCDIDSSMSEYVKKLLQVINDCSKTYNNSGLNRRVSIINKFYGIAIVRYFSANILLMYTI
jgi:hypothetical protein